VIERPTSALPGVPDRFPRAVIQTMHPTSAKKSNTQMWRVPVVRASRGHSVRGCRSRLQNPRGLGLQPLPSLWGRSGLASPRADQRKGLAGRQRGVLGDMIRYSERLRPVLIARRLDDGLQGSRVQLALCGRIRRSERNEPRVARLDPRPRLHARTPSLRFTPRTVSVAINAVGCSETTPCWPVGPSASTLLPRTSRGGAC